MQTALGYGCSGRQSASTSLPDARPPLFLLLPLYSHVDFVCCRWRAEGVAYTFGHAGGLIIYSFPDYELPDARRDELAVGLVTSQRSAVILRVVSGSSSDFIEMELVRSVLKCSSRPRIHTFRLRTFLFGHLIIKMLMAGYQLMVGSTPQG